MPYAAVYDATLTLVASSPGAGQIIGPITAGTAVTLPGSQTYNSTELNIFLNGQKLDAVVDYAYVGSVPRTQVTFVENMVVGDQLEFQIERPF